VAAVSAAAATTTAGKRSISTPARQGGDSNFKPRSFERGFYLRQPRMFRRLLF
jgi:hypothetical protein